ncbi:3-keto-disaccharide hydrolase [Zhouia amylolytica]|uniref:3-keto-alpha-glucoside-1,2-lyase/3-keto-2-hydroxy-glucal hydratase domain-containing protein n=1 Tax=Zhouia amylolytica AD3 TaxID=1286632 RepID=W2UKN6_9FLAO|nr:DUF1080 domain-containing protein [Zhouia amylolytica]ETN94563.1 hypothetical protein P278_25060 [Zhouia amylolytica AD3]
MVLRNIAATILTIVLLTGCKNKKENSTSIAIHEVVEKDSIKEKEPTKPEETEIWEPIPPKVDPTGNNGVPSDAVILFDGSDLNAWVSSKDTTQTADWILNNNGSMTVKNGAGNIQTKQKFGDIQLHIEWKNPAESEATNQSRGNSGIFLQNRYEIQVLDTYQNKTYVNGQAAAIYKQHIPLVNASKPSGEWQTYDVIYRAPQFDSEGNKTRSATVTVLHNNVLVQDHVIIKGTTEYIGWPKNEPHGKAPLKLQDHMDHSGVSFRNIWIREL